MEGLSGIHDGRKGQICRGYMVTQIEAISKSVRVRKNFPLSLSLYSNIESPYISDNTRTINEVKYISRYFKNYIWVFDRGFDRRNIIQELDGLPVTYVIRQARSRNLVSDGKVYRALELAKKMDIKYPVSIGYMHKRIRKVRYYSAKFGVARVRFEDSSEDKTLIVLQKFGNAPMLLLTNKPLKNPIEMAGLVKAYIQRWGCEESTRFLKSRENGFNLEDIRVLKYEGLKKMLVFVTFAYGFLCFLHQTQRKKVKKVISQNTKNFKPLPRFHFYRTIESTQKVLEKEYIS